MSAKSRARVERAYWKAVAVLGQREPANPHDAPPEIWPPVMEARRVVEQLHREMLAWDVLIRELSD